MLQIQRINILKKSSFLIISLIGLVFIIGCNSGKKSKGVFVNPPVKGLQYSTHTYSGATNDRGEFYYTSGEKITFKIDGFDIGTVDAASEIPVNFLDPFSLVNQLLQSIDTDLKEDLIDITGVKLPEKVKKELREQFELVPKTFDTHTYGLYPYRLTQAQLDEIKNNSQVILIHDTPVNVVLATSNLIASTPFKENVKRQSYFSYYSNAPIDGDKEFHSYSFLEDSTATFFYFAERQNRKNIPTYGSKGNFTWSIVENGMHFSGFSSDYVTLLPVKQGNQYVMIPSSKLPWPTINIYKSSPLTISDFNKKTIKLYSELPVSNTCYISEIAVRGISGSLKKHCPSQIFDIPITISSSENLDNTVYLAGVDEDSNEFSIRLNIIKGDINTGTYILISDLEKEKPRIQILHPI